MTTPPQYRVVVTPVEITKHGTTDRWCGWQTYVMPDHEDWFQLVYRGNDKSKALMAASLAAQTIWDNGGDAVLDLGGTNDNQRIASVPDGAA